MEQGKTVTDTIELLETIGKSAVLRHAPTEELMRELERADASDALKAAAKAGDGSLLGEEFGYKTMRVVDSHAPCREEEDVPEREPAKEDPSRRPHPDQSESAHF
ncbi:hypothetical protein [Dyella mobilis]|uniref:hypothetical protein n=1 Tax=Dyella mobilis TaxID=1849582 RepID=UPI001EF768E5|nr:hypothetical protein [Dyella mobilis]